MNSKVDLIKQCYQIWYKVTKVAKKYYQKWQKVTKVEKSAKVEKKGSTGCKRNIMCSNYTGSGPFA